MQVRSEEIASNAKKLFLYFNGTEMGRVRIYFIGNDLHDKPYALIEDLYIDEAYRGQSLGTKLMQAAIEEAKKAGCYKILATSRYSREQVHQFYLKLGFKDWGKEFRLNV